MKHVSTVRTVQHSDGTKTVTKIETTIVTETDSPDDRSAAFDAFRARCDEAFKEMDRVMRGLFR